VFGFESVQMVKIVLVMKSRQYKNRNQSTKLFIEIVAV